MKTPTINIRRKNEHFHTKAGWLDSRHAFSFSHHYDPENTHHGLLLVSNDDVIRAGTGFDTHPHRDMEIITWVMDGEIEHKDSQKNRGIIYPGLAQRMSAGTGIWHSEMNPSGQKDVHLVQMWVVPDQESVAPSYEQLDINPQLNQGGLVPIASGKGHNAAIRIRQSGAVLWGGRLKPGEVVSLPEAPYLHLHVAKGSLLFNGMTTLAEGDTVRLVGADRYQVKADDKTGSEVLIWQMDDELSNS